MKKFIPLLLFAVLCCASCNNAKDKTAESREPEMEDVDAPEEKTPKGKKITDRDYSINKENAYNNMFLDSMAMEKYIATNAQQIGWE